MFFNFIWQVHVATSYQWLVWTILWDRIHGSHMDWKMGKHFPVRETWTLEKPGNFAQNTGKWEDFSQFNIKNFSYFLIEVYLLKLLNKILERSGKFVIPKMWETMEYLKSSSCSESLSLSSSPIIYWSLDILKRGTPSKFGLGTGYFYSNKCSMFSIFFPMYNTKLELEKILV